MDTEEDLAYEEHLDNLYREWERDNAEEIKEKGVQEFLLELFRSHFLANPDLAKRAVHRLTEARSLLNVNDSACLALGYSAVEVGFKELLLKPTVTGLVHATGAASVIAEIVISRSTPKHFQKVLDETFSYAGVRDTGTLKGFDRSGVGRQDGGEGPPNIAPEVHPLRYKP